MWHFAMYYASFTVVSTLVFVGFVRGAEQRLEPIPVRIQEQKNRQY